MKPTTTTAQNKQEFEKAWMHVYGEAVHAFARILLSDSKLTVFNQKRLRALFKLLQKGY